MTPQARHAIRAAKNFDRWGYFAAYRYLDKRGIPFRLFLLAHQLETESTNPIR
jgi:hypothetical protein